MKVKGFFYRQFPDVLPTLPEMHGKFMETLMGNYEKSQAEYIAWQIVETTEPEKLDEFIRLVLQKVKEKRDERGE